MRARVLQALLSARRVYLPSREKLVRFAGLVGGARSWRWRRWWAGSRDMS
jgi:hypothetical protein